MDRNFIQSNNLVQLYQSGDISLRESREFEKFCLENPDFLESLPIPLRAKLKRPRPTLDDSAHHATLSVDSVADDQDDDDDDAPSRWQAPGSARVAVIFLSFALIAAAGGIVALLFSLSAKEKELSRVTAEFKSMRLQPPGSIQSFRTLLSEAKPAAPTLNLGAPVPARFIDLTIDVTKENFNLYLITIDDVTRGRVMQVRRVARDSNKELRLTLNSSAFGAGDYLVQFEGYTWRGETVPVGWMRLGLK